MKKNIAVVTGGYSGEAVISLQSAAMVMKHLGNEKYNCYKVIITKEKWFAEHEGEEYTIDKNDFTVSLSGQKIKFDCAFISLHGSPGEDGKLQGYFDMIGLPYTSSGVLQLAITFNKSFTVAVLSKYGINVARSTVVAKKDKLTANDVLEKVSLPVFVKPNEGGSSIGTTKVKTKEQLLPAIERGLKEGEEVIVEEFIEGTEITCGVINYKGKITSLAVTEIVAKTEFFDFDAKYKDKSTEEITPARISETLYNKCKKVCEYIYQVLGCRGMIRVDFIIKNNLLYMLEVNSVPGMTERSLIPQQAEYIGLSAKQVYENAIEQALSK